MSSTDDLLLFIRFDEQMASLLPVNEMPKNVPFQPAQNVMHYRNNFPYGSNKIASIHVAVQHGLNIDEVDFCFGGSTLQMLGK